MDRRTLIKLLLGTALAEAVDVEQLLWVPKPIITVPGHEVYKVYLDSRLTDISMLYMCAESELLAYADRWKFPVGEARITGRWE